MKKIIIMFILLLASGCSCKYELSIQNGKVNESLIINGVTTEIPEQADLENFSNHSYNKTFDNDILKYQTSFNLGSYKNSDFLTCFDSYTFVEEEDNYVLKTGKSFKCLPYQYNDFDMILYDELEITLSTNHEVKDHNASKVEDGVYYWYINDDNINNTEIYFKISKSAKNPNLILFLAVFLAIVLVIGFIAYLIAKNKGSKNNQI